MAITITLGSKEAIILAIGSFIENSKRIIKDDEPVNRDELIHNIEAIGFSMKKQRYWLERI